MKHELLIEVSGDRELSVEVDVEFGYDGIGAYECHGYKGYDKGNLCIEGYSVVSVKDAATGAKVEIDAEIETAIEAAFERAEADIYAACADDGDDYPDSEPEDREERDYSATDRADG
jgi:hypothetical protein